MKKAVFALLVLLLSLGQIKSQCAPACGIYTLTNITYSSFPNSGTFVTLGDDDTTGFVPIGFTFNFYCNNFTAVKISSNGFITFSNAPFTFSSSPYAQSLPSSTIPNAVIAYNWNDLDPSAGGTVGYNTIGTSPNQIFIVTYSNVPLWSFGGSNTGQIVLYEADGSIEIHNGATINNGFLTHTEGIENGSGTVGSPVPGRNLALWTATNSAHRWEKVIVGTPPAGLAGNTLVCFGDPLLYTINNMSGASSYSWTLPGGWLGGSNATAISTTAGISGNLSVTATYTCGVSAPALISVTVNPPPLISISNVSPPVLCSGSVALINPTGAVSYTFEPGGITGTPPFTVVAAANTVYSLTGTSIDGCVNPTPVVVPITVYPSPTVTVNSGSICTGQTFTMLPTGAPSYSYSSLFPTVNPTIVGTYSYLVIGSASNACIGLAVSSVTVNPIPNTMVTSNRLTICAKESVTLSAQGANTYSWIHNNSTSTVQTTSLTTSTSYTVIGTNNFGCQKEATLTVVVNPCTIIDELTEKTNLFSVYPNPSAGEFVVKSLDELDIVLYDSMGKELLKKHLNAGELKLHIAELPAGYYILKAVSVNSQKKAILIKQ